MSRGELQQFVIGHHHETEEKNYMQCVASFIHNFNSCSNRVDKEQNMETKLSVGSARAAI